jgi:hypothetical protein
MFSLGLEEHEYREWEPEMKRNHVYYAYRRV